MDESGAAAWLPTNDTTVSFDTITIKPSTHLVIAGSASTTAMSSQQPSFLHIHPQGDLTVGDDIDVQTFVSHGGSLNLPGKNITISQSTTVWGALSTQPDTSISFTGDTMRFIPEELSSESQVLSLKGLTIHDDSEVILEKTVDAEQCGYTLDIHGGEQGHLDMKEGSSLTAGCPVSIVTSSVTLQHASFALGEESGPSLIRASRLDVLSEVSAGWLRLEGVDELNVGILGNLTFEPFYNNFTIATVESAGVVMSTLPLSVVSERFEITDGSFTWHGSNNSSFDSHSVNINGIFRPGDQVGSSVGFHDFEVGTHGDALMVMSTPFKVDVLNIYGEMRINENVIFTGKSNRSVNTFLVAPNGRLVLLDTDETSPATTEIHATAVTIDGSFEAGLLNIGDGFEFLQVGGHFEFDPVGIYELGDVLISGWFESHSPLVFGNITDRVDSYTFETSPGSTVKLNSQHRGDNLLPSKMQSNAVIVDGTLDAGLLEVHIGSLSVSGTMVFDPANIFECDALFISGRLEVQSPILLVGNNDTEAILETTEHSVVLLNSLGNANGSHGLPYSRLYLSTLKVGGTFTADMTEFVSPMKFIEVTTTGELQLASTGKVMPILLQLCVVI